MIVFIRRVFLSLALFYNPGRQWRLQCRGNFFQNSPPKLNICHAVTSRFQIEGGKYSADTGSQPPFGGLSTQILLLFTDELENGS